MGVGCDPSIFGACGVGRTLDVVLQGALMADYDITTLSGAMHALWVFALVFIFALGYLAGFLTGKG